MSGFKDMEDSFKECDWKYALGRVNQEMFKEHLYPADKDRLAMFCGPPGLITYACQPFCEKMGYTEEQMVIF